MPDSGATSIPLWLLRGASFIKLQTLCHAPIFPLKFIFDSYISRFRLSPGTVEFIPNTLYLYPSENDQKPDLFSQVYIKHVSKIKKIHSPIFLSKILNNLNAVTNTVLLRYIDVNLTKPKLTREDIKIVIYFMENLFSILNTKCIRYHITCFDRTQIAFSFQHKINILGGEIIFIRRHINVFYPVCQMKKTSFATRILIFEFVLKI